jgi:clan AA aspartic protease
MDVRVPSLPPFRVIYILGKKLGTFSVQIQVGDLAGMRPVQVEALVDTGASDTVLPQDLLRELGITTLDQFTYSLADGRIVEYDVGDARLRLEGRERTTQVVFGPEGVTPLLGTTTLQVFHLEVDPIAERLVPVQGLLKRLISEA